MITRAQSVTLSFNNLRQYICLKKGSTKRIKTRKKLVPNNITISLKMQDNDAFQVHIVKLSICFDRNFDGGKI